MTTAVIIRITPTHWGRIIWLPIPTRYNQKAQDLHLLAAYRLAAPTSCRMQPTTLSRGTTSVSGTENEDRMEVTVEMQIELQAPPEQMVRGMEREENILSSTSLQSDFSAGRQGSTQLRTEQTNPLSSKSSNDLRCLTTHLSSSKPPLIPPSFFMAFERVRAKRASNRPVMMYLALLSPDQCLQNLEK